MCTTAHFDMFGKDKHYLSYSAIRLWQQNKESYRKKYYYGEPDAPTVYTQFGKKIAELLEKRDFTEYPQLAKVPFYSISEQPLDIEVGGVPVRGFLDLYDPETFSFGEVKTGVVHRTNGPPWTQPKVRAHLQLPFYSLLIKKKFGKVQNKCHLIWLETQFIKTQEQVGSRLLEGEGRELELTGQMKIFPRSIAQWERDRVEELIVTTAHDIHEDYRRTTSAI